MYLASPCKKVLFFWAQKQESLEYKYFSRCLTLRRYIYLGTLEFRYGFDFTS